MPRRAGTRSVRGKEPMSGGGGWKRKRERRKLAFFRNCLGFALGKSQGRTTQERGSCRRRHEPSTPRDKPGGGGRRRAACTETPLPPPRGPRGSPRYPPPGPGRARRCRYAVPSPGQAGPLRAPQPRARRRPAPRGGRSLPVWARGRAGAGIYLPTSPPAPPAQLPTTSASSPRPHVTAGSQSPAERERRREGGRGGAANPLPAFPARACALPAGARRRRRRRR